MIGKKTWAGLAAVLFLAAVAWPVSAQTSTGKIKVSVENASLRDKPSLDAEIMEENIPLGTVFAIEKKAGDWYEVKFQSKMGVMITGYIHEMYVEVLAAEPAAKPVAPKVEPPKSTTPPQPISRVRLPGGPKFEIGLGFGMGFGSFMPSSSSFAYEWGPYGLLTYIQEEGSFGHTMKNPLGLGFSLAYYFSGGFGVKLRVDMNFKQSMDASQSDYSMTWLWNRPVNPGPHTLTNSCPVTGDMSVMPISLDVVYKFMTEGMFQPYVNAGISLFTGKANVDTSTGYGVSWFPPGWQYIGYVVIPMQIRDASLGSFGFNAGFGADIFFSPSIALTLDAAYFIGKSFDLAWTPVAGTYPLNPVDDFPGWTATIPADNLTIITDNLGPLTVKTSFFKIMVGVKVGL
jgi:opacity protein-like surface antigen